MVAAVKQAAPTICQFRDALVKDAWSYQKARGSRGDDGGEAMNMVHDTRRSRNDA